MKERPLARGLLLHPGNAIRSMLISRRADASAGGILPVVAAGSTRFQLARGARIETEGRVVFSDNTLVQRGSFGEMPAGPTIVRMTSDTSRLRLGAGVRIFGGTQLVVGPDARLEIGADTFVNPNARILCATAITIGVRCAISWRVSIFDFIGDHGVKVDGRLLDDVRPIEIGDAVLIGSGATILRGVTIGTGAIVGAGSVVTRDVAPNTLVAGNPARVVSENASWEP